MSKLLEIGPGAAPAINFIRKVNPDQIVFVGEPGNTISYDGLYEPPKYLVYSIGFLEYVRTIAMPTAERFDWVVASNVLNSPGTELTPSLLASVVKPILTRNGVLRIENTADMYEERVKQRYIADLERAGYVVDSYNEESPSDFIHQAMIAAFGQGFGLIATVR